jgi:hypothetical protein
MSVLRRLLSSTYRRARIAEARGEYRDAAALYAASGAELDAAKALAQAAERCDQHEDALATYRDALRWAPVGHAVRKELLGHFGGRVLRRARREGLATEAERRLLTEAAEALFEAGRFLPAADAYEMLEDGERLALCLERAGEVERLEALLTDQGRASEARRNLDRLLEAHRAALQAGARAEARQLLGEAARLAPGDPLLGEVTRELEARLPSPYVVKLSLPADGMLVCLGRLPIELGREGAMPLRGASLSRRHARVGRSGEQVTVEDLGSRNGTRLGGIPIGARVVVDAPVEIGLGDDVALRCVLAEDDGLRLRVERGLDRGLTALASSSTMMLPVGEGVSLGFPGGWATIFASREHPALLHGRACVAPIELLIGDRLELGGAQVEVLG